MYTDAGVYACVADTGREEDRTNATIALFVMCELWFLVLLLGGCRTTLSISALCTRFRLLISSTPANTDYPLAYRLHYNLLANFAPTDTPKILNSYKWSPSDEDAMSDVTLACDVVSNPPLNKAITWTKDNRLVVANTDTLSLSRPNSRQ